MDKEENNGENKEGENLSAVAKEQGYKKLSLKTFLGPKLKIDSSNYQNALLKSGIMVSFAAVILRQSLQMHEA